MAEFLLRSHGKPVASGAYSIARSLRFNSADSAYLDRTFGTPTTQSTYTFRCLTKRGNLGAARALFGVSTNHSLAFNSSDQLVLTLAGSAAVTTTAVFRDPAAWYDILYSQSGSTISISVNNVVVGSGSATSAAFNTAVAHQIGAANTTNYYDGYLADVFFIDGQALTHSSFGQTDATTGQWVPKQVTGVTYGTNGFWLSFYDNTSTTTLGRDDAGGAAGAATGSNDWTLNNFSVTAGVGNDSLTDTPTNNYPVLSPIDRASVVTLTNGGLDYSIATSHYAVRSSFAVSSGKWYWEAASNTESLIGIMQQTETLLQYCGQSATSRGYIGVDGANYASGASLGTWATYTTTDVLGFALDMTAGTCAVYKNNSLQGTWTGLTGLMCPATSRIGGVGSFNFGQRPFAYTPPTGFVALCTSNLPTPAIVKPSAQFDIDTYTSNGSGRTKTGLGFQPDLAWFKNRTGTGTDHAIYDSARGVQKRIETNNTDAEVTGDSTGLTAFNSDGYTTGALAQLNTNTATYVSWLWKEGVTPGLDIVTWTGSGSAGTVAHNLGVAPKFMMQKFLNTTSAWSVYHASIGNTRRLTLNTADAQSAADVVYWNNTSPTSSVFSVGTSLGQAFNMVTYCFAEVAGFSRFGSYTGNASADGPFVHCGFRPRFVMVKRTDAIASWIIWDAARETYNIIGEQIFPDTTAAASTGNADIDFLSNGFKIRRSGSAFNASGGTMIYAAFAEAPFKYANAR